MPDLQLDRPPRNVLLASPYGTGKHARREWADKAALFAAHAVREGAFAAAATMCMRSPCSPRRVHVEEVVTMRSFVLRLGAVTLGSLLALSAGASTHAGAAAEPYVIGAILSESGPGSTLGRPEADS